MLDIHDPRVTKAIKIIKERHAIRKDAELEKIFKESYHCEIVPAANDPWCTKGYLKFPDEKYETWFLLQVGEG